jgi:hypothetical protein
LKFSKDRTESELINTAQEYLKRQKSRGERERKRLFCEEEGGI